MSDDIRRAVCRLEEGIMVFLQTGRNSRPCLLLGVLLLTFYTANREAHAIPYYARQHGLNCNSCHTIVPKLNAFGQAFWNRGYRLPDGMEDPDNDTAPFAIWLGVRQQEEHDKGFSEGFLSKVELLSGGPIGENAWYFVEWRIGSLGLRGDGTIKDRGGRFEDVFVGYRFNDRWSAMFGQFRAVNQEDVSLRLSPSEPLIFSAGLPGDPDTDPRITSLRAFKPSGRSPGFSFTYQSIFGETESDGLFYIVTVPFVGELSWPLTPEAHDVASFELEGPAKGVFLETFYRKGLNSIGMHAFIDEDRYLLTGLGKLNIDDFFITAGLGVDDTDQRSSRLRSSLEVEYLPITDDSDKYRRGLGFRVENISHDGKEPAYIPYLVLTGPNKSWTLLMQIQWRIQEDNNSFVFDLSAIF